MGIAAVEPVRKSLQNLLHGNFSADQISVTISYLIKQKLDLESNGVSVDLVTTGPEAPGIANRDTAVVVRDLFSSAKESVLAVGFAVYEGKKVFENLAELMDSNNQIQVKLLLNIHRDRGTETDPIEIQVSRFVAEFKKKHWPENSRYPEVFYDPRSLSGDVQERSVLHAKCIVVDSEVAFISSANFTEAAQKRNIEVGVQIQGKAIAKQLNDHFQLLIQRGVLEQVL